MLDRIVSRRPLAIRKSTPSTCSCNGRWVIITSTQLQTPENRIASRLRFGAAVPSLDPNDAAASFKSRAYTFGIQDDWEVLPGLEMTFGFRYDMYDNPTDVPLNSNFLGRQGFSNRKTFNGEGVFQPRFGFNWQATERLVIRGGIGIFAGGTPDVFLSNSYSNTGQLTNAIDIQRNSTPATCNLSPANPALCATALTGVNGDIPGAVGSFVATNTASLAAAPVNAIDPDISTARQARATLSVNYDADLGALGDGWLFGIDALYGNVIEGYRVALVLAVFLALWVLWSSMRGTTASRNAGS